MESKMEKLPTPSQPVWSTLPEAGYSYMGTYWVPNENGIMRTSPVQLIWTRDEVEPRWSENMKDEGILIALSSMGSYYDVYMVIDRYSNMPYLTVRTGNDFSDCWNGIGLDALTVNLAKTPQHYQIVRDVFKRVLKELIGQNGLKEVCMRL